MIVIVALAATVLAAPEKDCRQPCETWIDPVLRVEFPGQLGGLRLSCRRTYTSGDDDYSLRYDSAESQVRKSGGQHLDLYVYTRGETLPDGAGDQVMEEIRHASSEIEQIYHEVNASEMTSEGTFRKSKLKFLWTSYTLALEEDSPPHLSITLVTAWRNRFVKLRYSEDVPLGRLDPCEELPKSIQLILEAIDALFAAAIATAKVDVYALANPTNVLAALRCKWLGADTRVSMAEMPDYADQFSRLAEIQNWCVKDMAKRADVFEKVAREGIRLKIAPQVWYYNLACTLARQKKTDAAFEALEQAIAAGYNHVAYMKEDSDLARLRKDARFGKLAAAAETIAEHWNEPRETAKVADGMLSLTEDNVYYVLDDRSYLVKVETDIVRPVVYLDHNAKHRDPPKGTIGVKFAKAFRDARRDIGSANIHFVDVRNGNCIPVVLASDFTHKENRLNKSMSIPADFAFGGEDAQCENRHFDIANTLGIYAVASDYGTDGIDRFVGNFPACLAHAGGVEEADKFVRLSADIVGNLPDDLRDSASTIALNVIRRAQKCVTNEATFMSGVAQRPVLSFKDIDREKAIAMVRTNACVRFPLTPYFKDADLSFAATPISDLWNEPYDRPHLASTCHNQVFVATWGERTASFKVEMSEIQELIEAGLATNGWRYVWKVLQGDEKKVRIAAEADDSSKVRIEVDYHRAFDAPLAGGRTIKTSRVDIGCFLLDERGRASLPAIMSVYFNPNETREYGADGRLVSIDYAKRQIAGWRPQLCAKGDWRDVFHYTKDGKLTGWTRLAPQWDGSVMTNEFTREGLAVMTRDALGRPKDVRRDLKMEWTQNFGGESYMEKEFAEYLIAKEIEYDKLDDPPCGEERVTTLVWQYAYSDDKDIFGKPSPKPCRPFVHRPELCPRAAFTAASGFRYPLMDQMMAGLKRHARLKFVTKPDDVRDFLMPPEMKKMAFCPWKPARNDLWAVEDNDESIFPSSNLVELADGAYRFRPKDQEYYVSVHETYSLVNDVTEHRAYEILDDLYRRGQQIELNDDKTIVTDGKPLTKADLPEDVEKAVAYWQLPSGDLFYIKAYHETDFGLRQYAFLRKDSDKLPKVSFQVFPSRAIGNTVLAAFADEAEAMNNLAVLLYAEVAHVDDHKEATIVDLLERAAAKGCATARRNLEVLRSNHSER